MNLQRMVEASKVTSFGAILAFEPLSNALASMMWDYCNDFRDIENWDVVDSTKQVEVRRRPGLRHATMILKPQKSPILGSWPPKRLK